MKKLKSKINMPKHPQEPAQGLHIKDFKANLKFVQQPWTKYFRQTLVFM